MFKKLFSGPYHMVILPAYFLVHNFFDYYGIVEIRNIQFYIVFWLILPFILFITLYFPCQKKTKTAALITSFALFIFFFYGPISEALRLIPILRFFTKVSVVLTLLFLILLTLSIFIKKIDLERSHLPIFINTVLLTLIVTDTISFIIRGPNTPKLQEENRISLKKINRENQPDIYFFIFDEHLSTKSADKYLKYNNDQLDSFLTSNHFFVCDYAVSAYTQTAISISSTFWATTFNNKSDKKAGMKQYQQALKKLELNPIIPFFQKNGYQIINTADYKIYKNESDDKKNILFDKHEQVILNQTLSEKLRLQIKSIVQDQYPKLAASNKIFSDAFLEGQEYIYESIKTIDSVSQIKSNNRKFIYAHFPLPHLPVLLDTVANPLSVDDYIKNKTSLHKTEAYFQNLTLSRKIIQSLITKIQKNTNGKAVIIIQGDHGYRGHKDFQAPDSLKHSILSAFYFPDHDYSLISHNFFSANTFRVLLKKYTDSTIGLLPAKLYQINTDFMVD